MKNPTGYIIYRGPSMIDNNPIIVIGIVKSKNIKTGNLVQTYILVDNEKNPYENAMSLKDVSVCGDCKMRLGTGGACYVNLSHGPGVVFRSLQRGIYPEITPSEFADKITGRHVRLGSYGDPAAVPVSVWQAILKTAASHTGYSHQWKNDKFREIMEFCNASVDNEFERTLAKGFGYRTFRVRKADEPLLTKEFICPASIEAEKKKTCKDCMACNGGIYSKKGDPVIISHGYVKNRF